MGPFAGCKTGEFLPPAVRRMPPHATAGCQNCWDRRCLPPATSPSSGLPVLNCSGALWLLCACLSPASGQQAGGVCLPGLGGFGGALLDIWTWDARCSASCAVGVLVALGTIRHPGCKLRGAFGWYRQKLWLVRSSIFFCWFNFFVAVVATVHSTFWVVILINTGPG